MSAAPKALICVDLGTTNTRVWRVAIDGRVLAKARAQVGVRDTAREGSPTLLRRTLQKLIQEVVPPAGSGDPQPIAVIAAGMITSSLGLLEIPQLPAPAGLSELAAATRPHHFPDITPLPIWLVPGVRSGPPSCDDPATISRNDMMRGEETLCMGLLALGLVSGEAAVLNLGSHWKAIQIDAAGRITGSVTSLAGEMIHAAQTTTILSSALPNDRPDELDPRWLAAGMTEQRAGGLPRALFCVRLLQLNCQSTPQQRLAYLVGAFIAADLDALISARRIDAKSSILLAGNKAVGAAWQAALAQAGIIASALSEEQIEQSMLAGLLRVFAAAFSENCTS